MKIIREGSDYDLNDIVLIESLTYNKLEFLTNDWILKTLYISKHQISLQESMTIKLFVQKSIDKYLEKNRIYMKTLLVVKWNK